MGDRMQDLQKAQWRCAGLLSDLQAKGRKLVKIDGKQIALFQTRAGVRACNNRCPHEGYPLIEGTLDEDAATGREDKPKACLLTCNWHNWRFDLDEGASGEGDALRLYPVEIRGQEIFVDVADQPAETRMAQALDNIVQAMPRHEYDRLGRELSRLFKAGGALEDAILQAIHTSHDRFEYGGGHAYAAAPDWLALADTAIDQKADKKPNKKDDKTIAMLTAGMEIIGHMAWDTLRERPYSFPKASTPYDEDGFLAAIERQDEAKSVAYLNGAFDAGLGFDALIKSFLKAALAHYQEFGHAVIYVYKYHDLARRLGEKSEKPLLLALLRRLINARREDLIPEFKSYRPVLEVWEREGPGRDPISGPEFYAGLPVAKVLEAIQQSGSTPDALYQTLLAAAALQMLKFDTEMDKASENTVSNNISWLDFTHAITMANAGRWAAERDPAFWPQVLLQIGCFLGRNSGYLDEKIAAQDWTVGEDPMTWLNAVQASLFDHDFPEYIVSCHYVKLSTAIKEEIEAAPDAPSVPVLLAALNRMLAHPIKRKHLRRTALQSFDFVAREG